MNSDSIVFSSFLTFASLTVLLLMYRESGLQLFVYSPLLPNTCHVIISVRNLLSSEYMAHGTETNCMKSKN